MYDKRLVLANTVADGMIVESTAFESKMRKGRMRIQAYMYREVGTVVGSVLGAVLFNSDHWNWGLTIAQCFLLQV
jgi:hypothetical protein